MFTIGKHLRPMSHFALFNFDDGFRPSAIRRNAHDSLDALAYDDPFVPSQLAPNGFEASATVTDAPPVTAIFFSLPSGRT